MRDHIFRSLIVLTKDHDNSMKTFAHQDPLCLCSLAKHLGELEVGLRPLVLSNELVVFVDQEAFKLLVNLLFVEDMVQVSLLDDPESVVELVVEAVNSHVLI